MSSYAVKSGTYSGYTAYQFTTAGADIDLTTAYPGYNTNPNLGDPTKMMPRILIVTEIPADPSTLVVKDSRGNDIDWDITAQSLPMEIPMQCSGLDSTSDAGIVGNAVY